LSNPRSPATSGVFYAHTSGTSGRTGEGPSGAVDFVWLIEPSKL